MKHFRQTARGCLLHQCSSYCQLIYWHAACSRRSNGHCSQDLDGHYLVMTGQMHDEKEGRDGGGVGGRFGRRRPLLCPGRAEKETCGSWPTTGCLPVNRNKPGPDSWRDEKGV